DPVRRYLTCRRTPPLGSQGRRRDVDGVAAFLLEHNGGEPEPRWFADPPLSHDDEEGGFDRIRFFYSICLPPPRSPCRLPGRAIALARHDSAPAPVSRPARRRTSRSWPC